VQIIYGVGGVLEEEEEERPSNLTAILSYRFAWLVIHMGYKITFL